MMTFIRVVEVWVPTRNRTHLELGEGLYGPLQEFKSVSEQMRFGYDEGLPGKAWAARHPIILKSFENSYFLRTVAAERAGLTCGVALPIFAGDFLMAVVVFFCGDDEEHVGAIELWQHDLTKSYDLTLADGYFGTAEAFEWVSRHTSFRPGFGLPGTVWQSGMPEIMEDLGRSHRFKRRDSALQTGMTKGLGIPCPAHPNKVYIMTFLSALSTPIARRFEIWIPDATGESLIFRSGLCDSDTDLKAEYRSVTLAKGEGTVGQVGLTGLPSVTENLTLDASAVGNSARAAGLEATVAMPIIDNGRLKSVVAWYF